MSEYELYIDCTLPSLGKVYSQPVDPNIRLRAMTTADEMKRLNVSTRPYKGLCECIDACIVSGGGISVYDMCLADFQYLMYQLHCVTYGNVTKVETECPFCGSKQKGEVDLAQFPVASYTEDLAELIECTLPVTGHKIRIRMNTPRLADDIVVAARDKKKSKGIDDSYMLQIMALIDTVDGEKLDYVKLSTLVQSLHMRDTTKILNTAEKLDKAIGMDTKLAIECDTCGVEYESIFRPTQEFFRPTFDD